MLKALGDVFDEFYEYPTCRMLDEVPNLCLTNSVTYLPVRLHVDLCIPHVLDRPLLYKMLPTLAPYSIQQAKQPDWPPTSFQLFHESYEHPTIPRKIPDDLECPKYPSQSLKTRVTQMSKLSWGPPIYNTSEGFETLCRGTEVWGLQPTKEVHGPADSSMVAVAAGASAGRI